VLAGERQCVTPAGFDQGNSPIEALERRGEELVLATNGAPTIVAATRYAPHVLVACLLNLAAVMRALQPPERVAALDVQIVCSGTDGAVALEDAYVAGRLVSGLAGRRTDAARVAERVAASFARPRDALEASAGAAALRKAGLAGDVAYCARESELECVPAVLAAGTGVAALADLGARPIRALAVDVGDTVGV
jgi:phosphosulfolactate phosphohydrolase-like enzyme